MKIPNRNVLTILKWIFWNGLLLVSVFSISFKHVYGESLMSMSESLFVPKILAYEGLQFYLMTDTYFFVFSWWLWNWSEFGYSHQKSIWLHGQWKISYVQFYEVYQWIAKDINVIFENSFFWRLLIVWMIADHY